MTSTLALRGAAACLVAVSAIGCASGTKSGGTTSREISIVMQTPDAPDADAEYFISQVKAQSRGRIQISEGQDYSSSNPNNELRLARALRNGSVEMAYIPSRAWERASSAVTAFRALQAPLLVTNYRLLRRITTGPIARSMLASLDRIGVVGLGLVPDELRRVLGRRPLATPAAFRGARIRVVTSPTSLLAVRAFGAMPLTRYTSSQLGSALHRGQVSGAELSTLATLDNGYVSDAKYLTANLALFAKTQTIAIRRSVWNQLSTPDQRILHEAALATVAHADPADQELNEVEQLCKHGISLVRARPSALAALRLAAGKAYSLLGRDRVTRLEIRAIERVRGQVGGATAALPACATTHTPQAPPPSSRLTGSYVMSVSQAQIAKASGNQPNNNWGSFRLTLRSGRFRMSDSRPPGQLVQNASSGWSAGTYAIKGHRITFTVNRASGDTPIGAPGDAPVICRWSLYRNTLTFERLPPAAQAAAANRGLDPDGPPALYVTPWQKASA